MLRNRLFVILSLFIGLLILGLGAIFLINNIRGSSDSSAAEATWCDKDASGLCVVSFGTDNSDRMIINFKLPTFDFPGFYVKGINRDLANVYQCELDSADQNSVHCTGMRTPLGEVIFIEVYSTDSDVMIAQGRFVVSALLVSTPIIAPPASEATPIPISPTLLPGAAYPNP